MDSERVFTVTELARDLRATVENRFSIVAVRGEVSNVRVAFSGHTYFTLKDDGAQLRCVLFKGTRALEGALVEDAEYLVWGRLSLYEARTDISLVVNLCLPAGEGQEAVRLRQLKDKLQKQGLFDESRKRPLPSIIEHVGVVTAPGGAAVQDIIRVGRNRYPALRITLFPALVQGEKAEESLVHGVEALGSLPDIDAIIVGRGGGSKEDLRAFNGEKLALAVAACRVPIVAAVGHEIDRTVLDLVADHTVSTPSAAAALCAMAASELEERLDAWRETVRVRLERILRDRMTRLDRLLLALPRPVEWLRRSGIRLSERVALLEQRMTRILHNADRRLSFSILQLETASPLGPLERGYVLVRQKGFPVKRRMAFDPAASFDLRFVDGVVTVTPAGKRQEP